MKILVVDDYKAGAFITGRLLESLGYEVDLVYDGPTAIEMCRRYYHDFILIDINMPGMDGYQACREIRRLKGTARPTILAFTGAVDMQVEQQARAAGFDDVVEKALSFDSLAAKLARWSKSER